LNRNSWCRSFFL